MNGDKSLFKKYFFLIFVLTFSGCQTLETQVPRVVSDVTIFHEFTPKNDETIFVLGAHESMNSSLEFKSYKQKIEGKFIENGISTVSSNEVADYIAVVNYGIDDGTTTTQISTTPIIGQTSGGTTTHSGSIYSSGGYSSYSGSSYSYPTYGIVGTSTNSYNVTVYNRVLTIDIFRNTKSNNVSNPTKVWEGQLKSSGSCGNINEVIDELIEAMFINFPGVSGNTERVEITYAQLNVR